MVQPCGKQYGASSKKLKLGLPFGTVIPPVGENQKELKQHLKEIFAHPCAQQNDSH